MIAIFVILATFVGLSMFVGTVMVGVMFAAGRWTLPGSAERRIQQANADAHQAKVKAEIAEAEAREAESRFEEQRIRLALNGMYEEEEQRQLNKGKDE